MAKCIKAQCMFWNPNLESCNFKLSSDTTSHPLAMKLVQEFMSKQDMDRVDLQVYGIKDPPSQDDYSLYPEKDDEYFYTIGDYYRDGSHVYVCTKEPDPGTVPPDATGNFDYCDWSEITPLYKNAIYGYHFKIREDNDCPDVLKGIHRHPQWPKELGPANPYNSSMTIGDYFYATCIQNDCIYWNGSTCGIGLDPTATKVYQISSTQNNKYVLVKVSDGTQYMRDKFELSMSNRVITWSQYLTAAKKVSSWYEPPTAFTCPYL